VIGLLCHGTSWDMYQNFWHRAVRVSYSAYRTGLQRGEGRKWGLPYGSYRRWVSYSRQEGGMCPRRCVPSESGYVRGHISYSNGCGIIREVLGLGGGKWLDCRWPAGRLWVGGWISYRGSITLQTMVPLKYCTWYDHSRSSDSLTFALQAVLYQGRKCLS